MLILFLDYTLTKYLQQSDLTYGPKLLETNFTEVLRGLLLDPISFDKYPDVVYLIKKKITF